MHIFLSLIGTLAYLKNNAEGLTSPYGWEYHRSLAGIWNFKISPPEDQNQGFRERWWTQKLTGEVFEMPVPSSFNDIGTDRNLRDYLGWVWYQTMEPVNLKEWRHYRKVISFGGVHYYCIVYFDEIIVGYHEGGHVPFEFRLPDFDRGYITVAVNNTLTNDTIPQGFVVHHPSDNSTPAYTTYSHGFDYFDYAGINRNVFVYATSKDIFIKDLSIQTYIQNDYNSSTTIGFVRFKVTPGFFSEEQPVSCIVTLSNITMGYVLPSCNETFVVYNPILWWNTFSEFGPPAYLYSITVMIKTLHSSMGGNIYRTKIGIRDVSLNNNTLLLNGKPIYLKGFGKHEDSDIRGRGFDWAVTLRDLELLKWTHANVIRTTHYPPSLEFVDMANKKGLLLIVESPACSLSNFGSDILERHKAVMKEIIAAYGSNPSIIMWSLANEPVSSKAEADEYFKELVDLVRNLDTRPITFVTSQQPSNDKAVKHVDVICVNRYNGWYSFPGGLDRIESALTKEVLAWRSMFNVPFMITEYGAGSLSGLHNLPSSMWSEDYQTDLLKAHFMAFDKLRASKDLAGEMMWVFADFATPQEYIRPGACVKGIFTRQRQPKKAAFTIRERYTNLDNCSRLLKLNPQPQIYVSFLEDVIHI